MPVVGSHSRHRLLPNGPASDAFGVGEIPLLATLGEQTTTDNT